MVSVEFSRNGQNISIDEIRAKEAERAREALKTLSGCDMVITFDGNAMDLSAALELQDSDVVRCCNETKRALTMPVILEHMRPILKESDAIWKDIAAKGHYKKNFKECYVDVHVAGIPLSKFKTAVPKAFKASNEDLSYSLHPEHYVFSKKGRDQFVLENLGTYRPVYSRLHTGIATKHLGYRPVKFDPDTSFAGTCEFFLMSDGSKMKTFAMHQIKPSKEGLDMRLGLFFPDSAPDEMIEGHRWHFCVEFYNAFMLLNLLINGPDASNEAWRRERLLTNMLF